MQALPSEIEQVVAALQRRIDSLPAGPSHRRTFIETYQRPTQANRLSSRRMLREARGKVWLNVAPPP